MKGDWTGQLPPGGELAIARTKKGFREAVELGVKLEVGLSPGPGCAVAEALSGQRWPVGAEPPLPLPGCVRKPCCACCLIGHVEEDSAADESSGEERNAELAELLAQMPEPTRSEVVSILNNALAGFGLPPWSATGGSGGGG